MSIGGRIRLLTAAVVLIAPTQLFTAPTAVANGSVTVVDLPSGVRAKPREVTVVGRSGDGHVLLNWQDDPTKPTVTPVLVAPDGTTQRLDETVGDVVGDRLVQPVADPVYAVASVTSRAVEGSAWTTVAVPDGARMLDYTADGLLVESPKDSGHVALLPWDGGTAVSVADLPAGEVGYVYTRVHRGSLSFQYLAQTATVVDTSTLQRWPVQPADPDCDVSAGSMLSFGDDTLAWQNSTSSGPVICTATIPASTEGQVTFTKRSAAALARTTRYSYRLVPAGDDVVVAPWFAADDAWTTRPEAALQVVAPDGTVRTLAPAGYGVQPAGPGRVVAVTGEQPGRASLRDIDVTTGVGSTVRDIDPVPATYSGIAVDGDTVYTSDDSAYLGGLRARTVDPAAGSAGAATLLDTDVTAVVTADGGGVAWTKSGWQDRLSGHSADGASPTYSSLSAFTRTDRRWLFTRGGDLLDSTTGVTRASYWTQADAGDFQDGVSYVPGQAIQGAPKGVVVEADVASRVATTFTVPPCAEVYGVQVAGSWMLVRCRDGAGTVATFVIDRTGATPAWSLGSSTGVQLGNGFAVARANDGTLTWTPLAGSGPSWQTLGSTAAPDAFREDHAVSVSRGSVPTVAWYDGDSAHVALLPVASSPIPPHPTSGVLPPSPVQVDADGADQKIRATWTRPPASDSVTGFLLTATSPDGNAAVPKAQKSSADMVDSWLLNLTNGAPYDVTVSAVNIAGRTPSTPVRAIPVPPPSAVTDLRVTVDPITSKGTVTWSYTQAPGTEAAQSFSIGGPVAKTVPPDRRSVSFTVDKPYSGELSVSSDGAAQTSSTTATVSFPGVDHTLPKAGLSGVPKVTFGHQVTLRLTASDNRKLADGPLDVRWRSAAFGHRLGDWKRPASWQRRDPGTLAPPSLDVGETACYSVRAHDAAGNVSAWTAPRCTATPIDDRALTALRDVSRLRDSRYLHGTASRLDSRRGALALRGPIAVTGWIVASTCPTCGRVVASFGGDSFGSVDLASAKRHDRVLLRIPGSQPQTGRLEIFTTTSRRAVIDGVVLVAH